jgi:hypothetical protein
MDEVYSRNYDRAMLLLNGTYSIDQLDALEYLLPRIPNDIKYQNALRDRYSLRRALRSAGLRRIVYRMSGHMFFEG